MKTLLAIPSYKRPYVIEKTTGYWLKQLVNIDWKIFIRKEEYLYYSQIFDPVNIVEIDVSNFRETINAIGTYARENKYDLVHKIDDDMSFKKLGKAKKTDAAEVYMQSYSDIVKAFTEDPDLYGVTIAKPMNHIRNKNKLFNRENKAIYSNYFIKSELLEMPSGIELFDDIYFTLVILKKGKKVLTYCSAYDDSVTLKNSGGLQTTDRNMISKNTITAMQKIFPEVQQGYFKGDQNKIDIDLKLLGIK